MSKLSLSRNILYLKSRYNQMIEQCSQLVFLLSHIGYSQWDDVDTRSESIKNRHESLKVRR